MKRLIGSLLIFIAVFSLSCRRPAEEVMNTPPTPEPEPQAVEVIEKKRTPVSKKSPLYEYERMSTPTLGWFYNRFGRSTWYYEAQLSIDSFSDDEYKQLIKAAYSPLSEDDKLSRQASTFALQYSIYKGLPNLTASSNYATFEPVLFDEDFLIEVVEESPSIIQYVPSDHPDFDEIAGAAIEANPFSFDYLKLRDKTRDDVIDALFESDDIFHFGERGFKKRALAYASQKQAIQYMEENGNYLELAPDRLKSDRAVVLAAIKTTPSSQQYADTDIQSLLQQKGIAGLISPESDSEIYIPVKSEALVDGQVKQIFEFESDRSEVVDLDLISRIESQSERALRNLWLVANVGKYGKLYVALFEPVGSHYLGAVIFDKNNDTLISKHYAATYDPRNAQSIWFPNDSGSFSPENFKILGISNVGEQTVVELLWVQQDSSKPYKLVQEGNQFKASVLLF